MGFEYKGFGDLVGKDSSNVDENVIGVKNVVAVLVNRHIKRGNISDFGRQNNFSVDDLPYNYERKGACIYLLNVIKLLEVMPRNKNIGRHDRKNKILTAAIFLVMYEIEESYRKSFGKLVPFADSSPYNSDMYSMLAKVIGLNAAQKELLNSIEPEKRYEMMDNLSAFHDKQMFADPFLRKIPQKNLIRPGNDKPLYSLVNHMHVITLRQTYESEMRALALNKLTKPDAASTNPSEKAYTRIYNPSSTTDAATDVYVSQVKKTLVNYLAAQKTKKSEDKRLTPADVELVKESQFTSEKLDNLNRKAQVQFIETIIDLIQQDQPKINPEQKINALKGALYFVINRINNEKMTWDSSLRKSLFIDLGFDIDKNNDPRSIDQYIDSRDAHQYINDLAWLIDNNLYTDPKLKTGLQALNAFSGMEVFIKDVLDLKKSTEDVSRAKSYSEKPASSESAAAAAASPASSGTALIGVFGGNKGNDSRTPSPSPASAAKPM